MKKRFFWLAILVCFSFLLTATGYAYSHNLSRIVSPESFEKKDYHPVEIVVKFCEGARPETFKAWLNHKNITNKNASPFRGGVFRYFNFLNLIRILPNGQTQ